MPLDEGKEADIVGFDLLEKAIHRNRVADVFGMHHAENITRDFVLTQEFIPAHHLLMRGLLAFVDAVRIVHILRPIQAEPDGKAFRGQKAAPLLIEEGSVRLHAVANALPQGLMLAL